LKFLRSLFSLGGHKFRFFLFFLLRVISKLTHFGFPFVNVTVDDVTSQAKVTNFTNEILVNQNIPRSKIAMKNLQD
jgi:hypothetical protein